MKRFALLLAVVLLVGCSSETKAPPQGEHNQPAQTPIAASEEAAVKAAKNADPRAYVDGWATWSVRLEENVQLEVEGKTGRHTVWVVEASHSDGEKLVIYVDATTYPPPVLKVDKKSGESVQLSNQEKLLLDRLHAYSMDAESLWNQFQSPREPSRSDFAALSSAAGVTFRDANPRPVSMGKEHVERAIRLLSTTIPLGEGTPPPNDQVDYALEFTGLNPPVSVVLAKNAAYFRGKVYYRPGLADWLGTNMHAN